MVHKTGFELLYHNIIKVTRDNAYLKLFGDLFICLVFRCINLAFA